MQNRVKQWLEQGIIDVFIGYKLFYGHPLPHVFSRDNLDECADLVSDILKYPLEQCALELSRTHPELKIGLLTRDCQQRSLKVLAVWNQLDSEKIRTLNLHCCPSNLAENPCDCSYLQPNVSGKRAKRMGIDPRLPLPELEAMSQDELFARWNYEFSKCIKCYGCRNICPVCFCTECSLEHPDLIHTGRNLADVPLFHMVRAVHMAGRCIDCGLCEQACPMDIPLRLLYRKINDIVLDLFDYQAGTSLEQPPLNILGDEVLLEPQPMAAR